MKLVYVSVVAASVLLSGCENTMNSLNSATQGVLSSMTNQTNQTSESVESMTANFTIAPGLAGQDPLLASYGTAVIMLFTAQELWLEAVGKDESAAKLRTERISGVLLGPQVHRTERIALENGAVIDSDAMSRHVEMSQETLTAFEEAKASEEALSEESQAVFYRGWGPYLGGLYQTRSVSMLTGKYIDTLKSSYGDIRKATENAQKVIVLGSLGANSMDFLALQKDTLSLVYEYAEDKNLDIPEDATTALGDFEI